MHIFNVKKFIENALKSKNVLQMEIKTAMKPKINLWRWQLIFILFRNNKPLLEEILSNSENMSLTITYLSSVQYIKNTLC